MQDVSGTEMLVKLDLFHAVQRVMKCIPKRHPSAYRSCEAFRLVFRDLSDAEEKRTLPTPSPQLILDNINRFLRTWKDISHGYQAVLTVAAIKEIQTMSIKVVFLIFQWSVEVRGMKTYISASNRQHLKDV